MLKSVDRHLFCKVLCIPGQSGGRGEVDLFIDGFIFRAGVRKRDVLQNKMRKRMRRKVIQGGQGEKKGSKENKENEERRGKG